MILTLWRGKSGIKDRTTLPPHSARIAYYAHTDLLDHHKAFVNYYRVTVEDTMRPGYHFLDSDRDRGIV